MEFSIEFLVNVHNSGPVRQGRITIGSFSEIFESSISFWNQKDYEKQWKRGLTQLLTYNMKSCLVTSMYDPSTANFIEIWPLYRMESMVLVHHNLLFFDDITGNFNPDDPYSHVPERATVNEDGHKISEWSISIDAVQLFADSVKNF